MDELVERIAQRTAELLAPMLTAQGTAPGYYSLAEVCARLARSESWVRRRQSQFEAKRSAGSSGRLMFPARVIEDVIAGRREFPTLEDRRLPPTKRPPHPRRVKQDGLLPVKGDGRR